MNITELSEREILTLQYSLLEELKDLTNNDGNIPFNRLNSKSKVKKSPHYNEIITLIRDGVSSRVISKYLLDTYGESISHTAISTYRKKAIDNLSENEIWVDSTQKTVERGSKEYNRFRESVLKRDKVCQCCGSSENSEVHHALSFKQYNSLGADTNNGIVLCKECHSKYHNENGYTRNVNPITLAQFLRDYGMNPQTSLDESPVVSEEDILKNIEEYEEDYGKCEIKRLLHDFREFGVDVNDIQNKLKHLIQVGKIYMPFEGIVKVA